MKAQTLDALQRDLKPCAHCGGHATLQPLPRATHWWRVRCDDYHCGMTPWAMIGPDVAAAAWNRRDGKA